MAATQWLQQYQQYQQQPKQQPQHYQQGQYAQGQYAQGQYAQGQQYQQPQQYQQNQSYQAQKYQQSQQAQPSQQYHLPPNSQPTQQFQQQAQGFTVQQFQQNQQHEAQHYQHAQQDQLRQQYQQTQQGPTAQQYPQIQQNQPAQQYPQQQSHQPQQGQNGYQHQYVPQKYQSQPHAPQQQGSPPQHGSPPAHHSHQQPVNPQQYGTFQTGPYQQTYQPQRGTTHGQSSAHSGPQPCFNCGNSGHFAMDCPEPIRAIPAGKANPQAFQNPLRKPKTVSTVAAQHQHRPHAGHAQASPSGQVPPHHGQTGYSQHTQHQQAYSPATPQSAHSTAQAQYYQQWQQYYQSQQAYQQGGHHQGSPYDQQQYTTPHGQATPYSNGSQTPSQTSAQVLPHTGGPQMYQSQFVPTSTTPVQFNQQLFNDKATARPDQRAQSSASVKSQSSPQNTYQIQGLEYNFEEDDLESLDIPDIPRTMLAFTNASQEPINLIGQPLPGNFVVADALAPFPQPAPQDEGCCKSRYHHDASLEPFKNSKYWDKEHADDVAFSDLPADGKIIPVDEILWKVRQRRAHPESSENTNRDSRSQSRTVSMNQDSLEVKTTLDRMERELAETKAKLQAKLDKGRVANPVHASPLQSVKAEQPPTRDHDIKEEYQTPPRPATLEKPIKSEQDAEDVLAALGVTGAPKPVTTITWPDQYSGNGSPHDMHISRSSRSSSRADIFGVDQHRGQSKSGQAVSEPQANGLSSYDQNRAPPPPPQTLSRQKSYPDGTHGSPHSAGLVSVDPFGYNTNGAIHSNGNGNVNGALSPLTDGQASSPMELRSENSLSRKRHRDSTSDEEDTPKRRQQDDYTPKLKRRQPIVAEAYSRRW